MLTNMLPCLELTITDNDNVRILSTLLCFDRIFSISSLRYIVLTTPLIKSRMTAYAAFVYFERRRWLAAPLRPSLPAAFLIRVDLTEACLWKL